VTDTAPSTPARRTPRESADLFAGAVLAISAVISVVMILHHPTLEHGVKAEAVMPAIGRLAAMDRLVHGVLIAAMGVLTLGLYLLSQRLGPKRPMSAAGLIAYAGGSVFVCIAAVIDGFVTPDLAAHCGTAAQLCNRSALDFLGYGGILIGDFTKVGLVAQSLAIAFWSVALVMGRGWFARGVGALGIVAGLAPAGIVLFSALNLTAHNLVFIFGGHALWYLAVGVWLMAARRGSAGV
jgi:hypothetical protein